MIARSSIGRSSSARRSSECSTFGLQFAAVSGQTSLLGPSTRSHVEVCLRCQAELATYRKLRRSLRSLRPVEHVVASRQIDELLASFDPDAPVHALRRGLRRRAYLGGVAAAITAAGAGAVVLAARLTSRSALAG